MRFRIIEVGEPVGVQTEPLDNRMYKITAETEEGTTIQTEVPVCFTKKSIKIHLERCLYLRDNNKKVCLKVGNVL